MSEEREQPEIIIPRYKLIVSYDIMPGNRDGYYQFVMGEFVPALQERRVYMTEAWHTAYGDRPLRLISFVSEDIDAMIDLLNSDQYAELEERLRVFVKNYRRQVVEYQKGFQFI